MSRVSVSISRFSRADKEDIARQIFDNLVARQKAGPNEPTLDAFIPEVGAVATKLAIHVQGKTTADAAREARIERAERTDSRVDKYYRHIDNFLEAESLDRHSPYATGAAALHKAASPDGLAHIDDRIIDENTYCRDMLTVLRDPEHEPTLIAIEFPMAWLDKLDAALTESEAAIADVLKARSDRRDHVDMGREAEEDWDDVMIRLRQYMSIRARRKDAAKQAECRKLIEPLLDTLQKYKTEAATRATRRAKAASEAHVSEEHVSEANGAANGPVSASL